MGQGALAWAGLVARGALSGCLGGPEHEVPYPPTPGPGARHQPLTCPLPTVSHSYGYGLLDAGAMVSLARNWTSVGPQRKCVVDILTEPR